MKQGNGIDLIQNTLKFVSPKDCSPSLWDKLDFSKTALFQTKYSKCYKSVSFGVRKCIDYSMWPLESKLIKKKKKQIRLNDLLYSPHFTPSDVYLLQKLGLSSKKEDLALFRYLKVCHRGIYNTEEDSNQWNEHVTSITVF